MSRYADQTKILRGLYGSINALGGKPGDSFSRGYVHAIDEVLGILEVAGFSDKKSHAADLIEKLDNATASLPVEALEAGVVEEMTRFIRAMNFAFQNAGKPGSDIAAGPFAHMVASDARALLSKIGRE